MALADHLAVVLERQGVPVATRTRLIAEVTAAVDPPRTRALLLAHHPRGAAFLAAFDGDVLPSRSVGSPA